VGGTAVSTNGVATVSTGRVVANAVGDGPNCENDRTMVGGLTDDGLAVSTHPTNSHAIMNSQIKRPFGSLHPFTIFY
jgi:hypothetical protein